MFALCRVALWTGRREKVIGKKKCGNCGSWMKMKTLWFITQLIFLGYVLANDFSKLEAMFNLFVSISLVVIFYLAYIFELLKDIKDKE